MSLSIPFTFTGGPGNKAKASEVNSNFQAVANKFTEGAGGISDADISTAAAIKGTKLSNVAGNRVPTDRIEDDAIDAAKLKDDAGAGAPNAAVGSAAHIKDAIITNAKLVNATLLAGKIKINSVSIAGGQAMATNDIVITSLGKTSAQIVPLALYVDSTGAGVTLPVFWLSHRTADDLYYLVKLCPSPFTIGAASGVTYVLVYIDKA